MIQVTFPVKRPIILYTRAVQIGIRPKLLGIMLLLPINTVIQQRTVEILQLQLLSRMLAVVFKMHLPIFLCIRLMVNTLASTTQSSYSYRHICTNTTSNTFINPFTNSFINNFTNSKSNPITNTCNCIR